MTTLAERTEPTAPGPGRDHAPNVALRLAAVLMIVILGDLVVVEFFDVRSLELGTGALVACVLCEAGIVALQVLHSLRWVRIATPWWTWLSLAALAGLVFLPMIWFGGPNAWGGFCGFLMASTALVVRPFRLAAALIVAMCVTLTIVGISASMRPIDLVYLVLVNILFGLASYAATWMSDLVLDLHDVRYALARLAVERERIRFSRDLDELLGYSLSAITLKSELADRLVRTDAERAKQEIASALSIARQALLDVRSVARSYKELSLDAQVSSAETMLAAAGVTVEVVRADVELPTMIDTVLGTVVRESVRNLLQHSSASSARVIVSASDDLVTVLVANDGLTAEHVQATDLDGHAGLGALNDRLQIVGGSLSAGTTARGWFEVRAEASPRVAKSLLPAGELASADDL